MIGIDELIEIGGIVFFVIEVTIKLISFIKATKRYKLLFKTKYDKIELVSINL